MFPKVGKRIRTHRDADKALDRKESAKVKERSGGRCEVWERDEQMFGWGNSRCKRAATQVHHMMGGRGVRGRGESALAIRKQHLCDQCHLDITGDIGGKRLKRIGGMVPHYTDVYERIQGTRERTA